MCVLDIELPFSSLHLPLLSPSRGSTAALPRTKPELEETQPIFPGVLEMGKGCRNSVGTTEQDKHRSSWLFLLSQRALAAWASFPGAAGGGSPGKLGRVVALGKAAMV